MKLLIIFLSILPTVLAQNPKLERGDIMVTKLMAARGYSSVSLSSTEFKLRSEGEKVEIINTTLVARPGTAVRADLNIPVSYHKGSYNERGAFPQKVNNFAGKYELRTEQVKFPDHGFEKVSIEVTLPFTFVGEVTGYERSLLEPSLFNKRFEAKGEARLRYVKRGDHFVLENINYLLGESE